MSEIYNPAEGGNTSGYYNGETDSGNNTTGIKGIGKGIWGQDKNILAQQDLETQALSQNVFAQGQNYQMMNHAGYMATEQSMQLTGAKIRASDAIYGNMTVEQEAMRQSMEFRREIMSDQSLDPAMRVELLGKLTQQMRSADNYKTNASMQSTVGGASHGTFQKGITDNGMNSMSMDTLAEGQKSAFGGQGNAMSGLGNMYTGFGEGAANGNFGGGGTMGMGMMGMGMMGMGV